MMPGDVVQHLKAVVSYPRRALAQAFISGAEGIKMNIISQLTEEGTGVRLLTY